MQKYLAATKIYSRDETCCLALMSADIIAIVIQMMQIKTDDENKLA